MIFSKMKNWNRSLVFPSGNNSPSHPIAKNIYILFSPSTATEIQSNSTPQYLSWQRITERCRIKPIDFCVKRMSQCFNVFFKHTSVGCSAQFLPLLKLGSSTHAITVWLTWWIFLEVPFFSLSCSFAVFSTCLPSLSLKFLFLFPLHLVHSSNLLGFFSSFLVFFLDAFGLFDSTSKHVHVHSALTLSIY